MSMTARFPFLNAAQPIFGAKPAGAAMAMPVAVRFGAEPTEDAFVKSAVPEPHPHELEMMPLEESISNTIVEAVHLFARAYPYKKFQNHTAMNQFVDSIHLAQDALGATRFWGSMNAQSRRRSNKTENPMTPPAKLEKLIQWGADFREKTLARQTTEAGTAIMTKLCDAYDEYMELTREFPDQHNYDDFQKGMKQIDRLLVKLANGEKIQPK